MEGTVGGGTICRFAIFEDAGAVLGGTVTTEVTAEGGVVTVEGCAPPTTQ